MPDDKAIGAIGAEPGRLPGEGYYEYRRRTDPPEVKERVAQEVAKRDHIDPRQWDGAPKSKKREF